MSSMRGIESARSINEFVLAEDLGVGTFGTVVAAVHKDGTRCAVKRPRNMITRPQGDDSGGTYGDEENGKGAAKDFVREVAFLKRARHPNVVHLYAQVTDGCRGEYSLVLERARCDLKQYMRHLGEDASTALKRDVTRQVLEGLRYIHGIGIAHLDVKPQNMLVGESGRVMLSDFGIARETGGLGRRLETPVATVWYRPPELLLGLDTYNPEAVDIWGAGCVFAEVFGGEVLFHGDCSDYDQLIQILSCLGTPDEWPVAVPHWNADHFPRFRGKGLRENCAPVGADGEVLLHLLSRMLAYDHRSRPSAASLLGDMFWQTSGGNLKSA